MDHAVTTQPIIYARVWRRSVAWFLDLLLLITVTAPVLYFIYGHDYFFWAVHYFDIFSFYGFWDVVLTRLLAVGFIIVAWHRWGATPGKQLMHCMVVDAKTLQPVSYQRAALRLICYLASALPLYLGFFWAIWDKRRQGFHDKLAGTVVVYRPADYSQRSLHELMEASR